MKDRRVVVGLGVVLALLAGGALAFLLGAGDEDPDTPPPASRGGLVVEVQQPDMKVDLTRALPCYVNGTLIGLATHAECAQRNGVSSGQLDVGIGPEGELAYGEASADFAPLSPEELGLDPIRPLLRPPEPSPPVQSTRSEPIGICWRHSSALGWQQLSSMNLSACAQVLFDGRCERPGGAQYGRWGEETLRLVPGQVERSSDNRNFRVLVRQADDCSLPR